MADELVHIYSGEWDAYWLPEGNGYTNRVTMAGVWPRAEAEARTSHCGPEKRIRLVPVNAERTDGLREMVEARGFYAVLHELTALAEGRGDGLLRFYVKTAADVAKNMEHAEGQEVGSVEAEGRDTKQTVRHSASKQWGVNDSEGY